MLYYNVNDAPISSYFFLGITKKIPMDSLFWWIKKELNMFVKKHIIVIATETHSHGISKTVPSSLSIHGWKYPIETQTMFSGSWLMKGDICMTAETTDIAGSPPLNMSMYIFSKVWGKQTNFMFWTLS